MWIGLLVGWILGSATFYGYLLAKAREPKHEECMDCHLSDCSECPVDARSAEGAPAQRAA